MPHGHARKAVGAVAALLLAVSLVPAPRANAAVSLSDIAGNWAAKDIMAAVNAGWVKGYPDGTFKPDAPVSRAEFVTMLVRSEGLQPTAINDPRLAYLWGRLAEKDNWVVTSGFVQAAVAAHIVEPTDYTLSYDQAGQVTRWSMAPETPLTRTEAAVMISRALGLEYQAEAPTLYPGSRFGAKVTPPPLNFTDAAGTPAWAQGWIGTVADAGVIKGYPDGTFHGERPIRRNEAVTLMQQLTARKAATPDLLAQIKTSRVDLVGDLPALTDRRFKPGAHLQLSGVENLDAPSVSSAWVHLPRAAKEAALKTQAQALWDQVHTKDLGPLQLTAVEVILWGKPGQLLAQGTFDGNQLTYWETDYAPVTTPNPDLESGLIQRIVVDSNTFNLDDEIATSKQMALDMQGALDHVERTAQYTLPYQYLGDWFTVKSPEVQAWVLQKAQTYYSQIKPQVAQFGGTLEQVRITVAPTDPADNQGKVRSLKVAETLQANPVAEYTYDGQTLTEVHRAQTLTDWLGAMRPVYELQGGGDGAPVQEIQDPAPDTARQRMAAVVYTLGRSK